jgi:hypothetical protein
MFAPAPKNAAGQRDMTEHLEPQAPLETENVMQAVMAAAAMMSCAELERHRARCEARAQRWILLEVIYERALAARGSTRQ